ncbi:MAG: hypothetical protein HKP61_06780, partial [Dactylosporangium sp.]|nr:hypothetical protein [Dactylosporangium sp.]NNJ60649.1 hypothetical protein [Dactylosporangium sp.]
PAASAPQRPGEMAFGLVQLGLAAARLGMADTAHRIVTALAARYWRPSLVSTHNAGAIFNVDICGGFVALVLAMLVGSGRDTLDLLPALPSAWERGEVGGIAGCDQVTVARLAWTPERLEVELTATTERRITIGIGNTQATVALSPDRPVHLIAARSAPGSGRSTPPRPDKHPREHPDAAPPAAGTT